MISSVQHTGHKAANYSAQLGSLRLRIRLHPEDKWNAEDFKYADEPAFTYSDSEEADDRDPAGDKVIGDVNVDGIFSMADIVMMQKWLVNAGDITDRTAGDLCADGRLNVFDLCVMKQLLTGNDAF